MANFGRRKLNPLLEHGAEFAAEGVSVGRDWRYDLICDYLKASASYEAVRMRLPAHKLPALTVSRYRNRVRPSLPADAAAVAKVVQDFGAIYKLQEPVWWQQIGMRLYGIAAPLPEVRCELVQSKKDVKPQTQWTGYAVVVAELPTTMTVSQALRQLRKKLEGMPFARSVPKAVAPKYQLYSSKLRRETLQNGLDALRLYERGMPLWRIGNQLRLIPAQSFDESEVNEENAYAYSERKEVLSIAARRLIRTAALVAENAARGRFPCDKPFAEAQLDYYKRKAGRPVGSKRMKRRKAGA